MAPGSISLNPSTASFSPPSTQYPLVQVAADGPAVVAGFNLTPDFPLVQPLGEEGRPFRRPAR